MIKDWKKFNESDNVDIRDLHDVLNIARDEGYRVKTNNMDISDETGLNDDNNARLKYVRIWPLIPLVENDLDNYKRTMLEVIERLKDLYGYIEVVVYEENQAMRVYQPDGSSGLSRIHTIRETKDRKISGKTWHDVSLNVKKPFSTIKPGETILDKMNYLPGVIIYFIKYAKISYDK